MVLDDIPTTQDGWRSLLLGNYSGYVPETQFTNGFIINIFNVCNGPLFSRLIRHIVPPSQAPKINSFSDKQLLKKAHTLAAKKKRATKKKSNRSFLNETFTGPDPRAEVVNLQGTTNAAFSATKRKLEEKNNEVKHLKIKLVKTDKELQQVKQEKVKAEVIVGSLHDEIEECRSQITKLTTEIAGSDIKKLSSLQTQFKLQSNKIVQLHKQMSKLQPRNMKRKLERRDSRIHEIDEELKTERRDKMKMEEKVAVDNAKITKLENCLADSKKECIALRRSVCKLKGKKSVNDWMNFNLDDISAMEKKITALTAENVQLQQLNALLESKELKLFEDGKYNDDIREVVMDLLAEQVGVLHIGPVIKIVLNKLANISVDRLPSTALINTLRTEALFIAKFQAAQYLLESNCNTLHTDGTSRQGHHFQSFQVSGTYGSLSLGLSEIVSETTDTLLDTFQQSIKDLADFTSPKSGSAQMESKLLCSLTNTMSDRHIVNKCFNEKLYELRARALPEAIPDFVNLPEGEKLKVMRMNNRFCGMHVIVNLASAADAALNVWEKLACGNRKLGASSLPGHFTSKSESSTQRLIRTTCKALERHGCEKSGIPVHFNTYLSGAQKKCELITFRGNRFNVIFKNGGAVYYHREDIQHFLGNVWDNLNKLHRAVLADVNEDVLLAGSRALGIISKIITTPLWNLLESNIHISEMTAKYQVLIERCRDWSIDPSPLLDGSASVFSDIRINKDHIYDALFKPDTILMDTLTLEALKVLMGSSVLLLTRQLEDLLPGGLHASDDELSRQQMKHMPKTNTVSERDFGTLDSLKKVKPNMSVISMEANIMFLHNKTTEYITSLNPVQKKDLFQQARNQSSAIKNKYEESKKKLCEERRNTLQKKVEEKRQKQEKKLQEKTRALSEVAKDGGLWETDDHIDEQLSKSAHDLERQLKAQLRLRKVMGYEAPTKSHFNFSAAGKKFSVDELANNLKEIIKCKEPQNEDCVTTEEFLPQEQRKALIEKQLETFKQNTEKELIKVRKMSEKKKKERSKVGRKLEMEAGMLPELVGKRIEQLFEENDKSETWWSGTVIRQEGSTNNNALEQMFIVRYDEEEEDSCYALYQDYIDGDLRFLEE